MMSPRGATFAMLMLAVARRTSGCGYSLSGRGAFLPAHIKIIGVPMFVNNTPVFEIEQKITAKVLAELIGRGRYEVKPNREGVDAVLIGEIHGIAIAPAAFNDQQQATRYAVTLVAKIEFRDLKTDKVLWAEPADGVQRAVRRHHDADGDRSECVPGPERERDGTPDLRVRADDGQRDSGVVLSLSVSHRGVTAPRWPRHRARGHVAGTRQPLVNGDQRD